MEPQWSSGKLEQQWGPIALTTRRKKREVIEKGGWPENPTGVAQLTYLNFSVQALPKLVKSYSPTCGESRGESLEVEGGSGVYPFKPRDVGRPSLIPDQLQVSFLIVFATSQNWRQL